MKKFLFIILGFTLLSATQLPVGFQEDLVVYGLQQPVCAEYAPDGRLFILEKPGRIRIFKDGKLLSKPFLKLNVDALYERGLLSIAFDPNFANNHYVYIYRTIAATTPSNVVERYTANADIALPSTRVTILSGIRSDAGIHNAGCLKFGPDGKLYVSTGDGGLNPGNAQDLQSLNGKILRINPDGSSPSDNPFSGQPNARPEIWAYGFRNPWRFAIHPNTGQVVIGDVGGDRFEEINIGRAGGNFGWPVAEGPAGNPSYIDPVWSYDHNAGGAAVVIGGFYSGKKFPSKYQNRLFVTDYSRKFIQLLKLDSAGVPQSILELATGLVTPVHMLEGPDGSLMYVDISAGEVRKVKFVGGKNRPPVVETGAAPRSGPVPLTARFNAGGTFDPDGHPLTYEWDLGDGQKSNLRNPTHTYAKKGTYFCVLTVRDSRGGTSFGRAIKISAGNQAPVGTILEPATGTVIHAGDTIHFSGRGSDLEDGAIPPENMRWSAKLHHNDHTHPAMAGVSGSEGDLPVPAGLHGEGKLFIRLHLKITYLEGLAGTATVDLPIQ